jgi:endo-1,4-beta-D-glucanase Y
VTRRRQIIGSVLAAIAMAAAATACGKANATTPDGADPATTASLASGRAFLDNYVATDGRVVRKDQGDDTVSEGQAYAMLLDVAVGDQAQFATVLAWSNANLRQSDGLFAYHWQGGKVVDTNPASDADLDIVRALLLAGSRWRVAAWTDQGLAYARAVLSNETVSVRGSLYLVAGPWARTAPFYVDPSYYDPATFALIAQRSGDPKWNLIEASSTKVISADTNSGRQLPSDWAQIDSSGHIHPSAPPGGGATVYGYDAFRVLVRQVDDCTDSQGKAIASQLLPLASKTTSTSDRADTYNLNATPSEGGTNPLMLIAAAGSATAAGQLKLQSRYLAEADVAAAQQQSYYLDAWVALGQYLLTTPTLSACSR